MGLQNSEKSCEYGVMPVLSLGYLTEIAKTLKFGTVD